MMTDRIMTEEEKKKLMQDFIKHPEDITQRRRVKARLGNLERQKGVLTPVEPGKTTVTMTRRRVPAHLEYIGKDPEEVAIGEKRTDWDLIKKGEDDRHP